MGKFVHSCTIQEGDLAGNEHQHEVTPWEFASGATCEVCGDRLATLEQIVEHLYEEATDE